MSTAVGVVCLVVGIGGLAWAGATDPKEEGFGKAFGRLFGAVGWLAAAFVWLT